MKKLFYISVIFFLCVCGILPANADVSVCSVIELTERFNKEDAACSVAVNAVPESEVNILVTYENVTTANIPSQGSGIDQIIYLDSKNADSNGNLTFVFETLKKGGVCKIKLKGNLYSAACETVNNDIAAVSSEDYFSVTWGSGVGALANEAVIDLPSLSYSDILTHGSQEMASSIKRKLDSVPAGKRGIFLSPDFISNLFFVDAVDYIFCDSGVEAIRNVIDEFFNCFYNIGGEVDFVYSDFEVGFSNWYFNSLGNNVNEVAERLKTVARNPRYLTEIRPELVKRNFEFYNTTAETYNENELYYVANWRVNNRSYNVWNGLMSVRIDNYLDRSFVEPIKKYFKNIKYSNYGSVEASAVDYGYSSSAHSEYIGGNKVKVGTHSSPVLYGAYKKRAAIRDKITDALLDTKAETPFNVVSEIKNTLYSIKRYDSDGGLMPWIHTYCDDDQLRGSPYYFEMLYHVMMYNPEPMLLFGPYYRYEPSEYENAPASVAALTLGIRTMNSLVGEGIGTPVLVPPAFSTQDYIVSGIETNDEILWRYTPNFSAGLSQNDLTVTDTESEVKFCLNNQEVTFAGGEILTYETSLEDVGYFVKTPKNVMVSEEINSAERTSGELRAAIKTYDKEIGTLVSDFNPGMKYTVALKYDNATSTECPARLITAYYDVNGILTNINVSDENLKSGFQGDIIFDLEISDSNIKTVKFFLWDNQMRPLTDLKILD